MAFVQPWRASSHSHLEVTKSQALGCLLQGSWWYNMENGPPAAEEKHHCHVHLAGSALTQLLLRTMMASLVSRAHTGSLWAQCHGGTGHNLFNLSLVTDSTEAEPSPSISLLLPGFCGNALTTHDLPVSPEQL